MMWPSPLFISGHVLSSSSTCTRGMGWSFSQTWCVLLGNHPSEHAFPSWNALSFPLDMVNFPLWDKLVCGELLDLYLPSTLSFSSSNSLSSFPLRDLCTLTFLQLAHSYFYSSLRSPLTYNSEKHSLIPHSHLKQDFTYFFLLNPVFFLHDTYHSC